MNVLLHPHRRYNPLTREWVLVSPQRTQRPWQGKQEALPSAHLPEYDPGCYLCPGNVRAGGETNPAYSSTFVFTNDFPALLPDDAAMPADSPQTSGPSDVHSLFRRENVGGTSRVVCFSPRHNLTLAQLPLNEVRNVVDAWAAETRVLGEKYRWVQVFENKGEMMGCSNPHPHGQIWAGTALPNEALKEDAAQRAHLSATGSILLEEYCTQESIRAERIVAENTEWLAVVPFWAVWPFELLVLPRTHVKRLPDLTGAQRTSLAALLKTVLAGYDTLFSISFPYTLGWHGAPYREEETDHWQLHAHVYPPLLRSATVRKYMVGYEMLAEPQRDLTPESAAQVLRDRCAALPIHGGR